MAYDIQRRLSAIEAPLDGIRYLLDNAGLDSGDDLRQPLLAAQLWQADQLDDFNRLIFDLYNFDYAVI